MQPSSRTSQPIFVLSVALLAACAGEYDVRIQVEPPDLLDGAAYVEVAIVPNCAAQTDTGAIVGQPIVRFVPGEDAPPLGTSELGERGLFVRLVDETCQVIAAGCSDVTLQSGGGEVLRAVARGSMGNACRATETCSMGTCVAESIDGGTSDGGTSDGAINDGGGEDMGMGAEDAGDAAITDAGVDAMDGGGECVEGAECPGGVCRGGSCCTGCWDGATCLMGDEAAACGNGGQACAACDCPTPSCTAGTCGGQPMFRDVILGSKHSCVILEGGALYCAGDNERGQLGLGFQSERELTFMRVGTESDWSAVSAGRTHTCAIRNQELYCWGGNLEGEAGLGAVAGPSVPTRVGTELYDIVAGVEGQARTIARRVDGTWVVFGRNGAGQLNVDISGNITRPMPMNVPVGETWMHVSQGPQHGCGVTASGALYCWGINDSGQTGLPASPGEAMHIVGSGFTDVYAGKDHTCAVDEMGRVSCMGANAWRVLGRTSDATHVLAFTDDLGAPTMVLRGGYETMCAYRSDGVVMCWGENDSGELGFGNTTFRNAVREAPHFMGAPPVDLARNGAYAFLDGENKLWGRNSLFSMTSGHGRLGTGDLTDVETPTLVCIPETE